MRIEKKLSRKRGRRGQSMVIYAVISSAILMGTVLTGFKLLPDMLNAINTYTTTLYFCINLPLVP